MSHHKLRRLFAAKVKPTFGIWASERGSLEISARGIVLKRRMDDPHDPYDTHRVPHTQMGVVQLARSKQVHPRTWFASVVGRPARETPVLVAEVCSRNGAVIAIHAVLEDEALETLPERYDRGHEVSIDALFATVATARSMGAQLLRTDQFDTVPPRHDPPGQ